MNIVVLISVYLLMAVALFMIILCATTLILIWTGKITDEDIEAGARMEDLE